MVKDTRYTWNIENANINQNVVKMRVNNKFTTPQYLTCFLNSKLVRFQIENLFTGTYPILTYPKIKSLKIFIKDKGVEKSVTDKLILAEEKNIQSLKLIREAQLLFLKLLNVDFSAIKKPMFYAVSGNQFSIDDMMTPAFYYPLYTRTTKEIAKNNTCEWLGKLADFKKGDEVGTYQAMQRTVVASTIPHLREDRIGDFSIPILKNQTRIIQLAEAAFTLRDQRKKLIADSRLAIENSMDI